MGGSVSSVETKICIIAPINYPRAVGVAAPDRAIGESASIVNTKIDIDEQIFLNVRNDAYTCLEYSDCAKIFTPR